MKKYRPMLAQEADAPFTSPKWIFEIKWDGIRAIAYVKKNLSLRSRNGKELSQNFPELHELSKLTDYVVLDGEIVIVHQGKNDFQLLIQRMTASSDGDIKSLARQYPATYVVFDILEHKRSSLLDTPLISRKAILENSLQEGKHVKRSVYVENDGETYFTLAVEKGLEGIIGKAKQSGYEPGRRSNNWLKIKKVDACDCVILGYTEGTGRRGHTFGALILGLYDGDNLVYIGKVGTGFTDTVLVDLSQSLQNLVLSNPPIEENTAPPDTIWVRPVLVCQVEYQTVTKEGKLRLPRFRGLRLDKTPKQCTIDQLHKPALKDYVQKRDFRKTTEPHGRVHNQEGQIFVIQEHSARKHHYDLRLERGGVLKSWAVPKGVPQEPGMKHLAIQTEDHPLEYGAFEGVIPPGEYGAGHVKIWDTGVYTPLIWKGDKIEVLMLGSKLKGRYALVRMKKTKNQWLIIKGKD